MYQKTILESQFFCQIKTYKESDERGASFTSKDKLSRHIHENHLGVDSQQYYYKIEKYKWSKGKGASFNRQDKIKTHMHEIHLEVDSP